MHALVVGIENEIDAIGCFDLRYRTLACMSVCVRVPIAATLMAPEGVRVLKNRLLVLRAVKMKTRDKRRTPKKKAIPPKSPKETTLNVDPLRTTTYL